MWTVLNWEVVSLTSYLRRPKVEIAISSVTDIWKSNVTPSLKYSGFECDRIWNWLIVTEVIVTCNKLFSWKRSFFQKLSFYLLAKLHSAGRTSFLKIIWKIQATLGEYHLREIDLRFNRQYKECLMKYIGQWCLQNYMMYFINDPRGKIKRDLPIEKCNFRTNLKRSVES